MPPIKENELSTSRLEALSDGVFAIVMTLLVIELKFPSFEVYSKELFLKYLWGLSPHIYHYFLSFFILGVYWVGHHKQFHYIQNANRILLWLNILFLAFIALIPFSTSLVAKYHSFTLPVLIYSLHLFLTSALLYFKWSYATNNSRFICKNVSPEIINRGKLKIGIGTFLYSLAIVLSFLQTNLSLILILFVPVLYILPVFEIKRKIFSRIS